MSIHSKSQNNTQNEDQIANQKNNKSTLKFTHLTIKNLKAQNKRKIFWCYGMSGFGIRVSRKGLKTWIFQYRIDGKQRLMLLGRFPKMSLSQAIKEYALYKQKVDYGIDPLNEREIERNNWKRELTVGQLIESYVSYCQKTNKKTYKDEERTLNKDMPYDVKAMKISEVSPQRLSHAIDVIISRGSLSMAEHFYRYTRRMFNYACEKGLIDHNPCSKIKVRIPKKKRQRHLDLREIYLFWYNIDKLPICHIKRLLLKFLLCTVTRPIDVRHMKWSHINLNQKIWTLPTTKNGMLHRVYLGSVAIDILKDVKRTTGNYGYVFGSFGNRLLNNRDSGIKALKPFSKGSLAQSIRLHFDMFDIEEQFYPYDLRRTGATMIAGLFGRRDFATMALNHTTSHVTGIYDQYTYDREKKMMLNALNNAIDLIISSPSVESIPDFETLRNKIINPSKTTKPFNEAVGDNQQDFQASFSSPVTYRLSFSHID